jgi:hypothetical protein
MSAVKRVEFINDRMSYITLRARWYSIIVPNVHASTEDELFDIKDRFYEELQQVFDKYEKFFRRYQCQSR